jgi:hypothetical protein
MEVVDTIKINLKGSVVELDMSAQFIEAVRKNFNLSTEVPITENHVKQFLVGAMKNALNGDDDVVV